MASHKDFNDRPWKHFKYPPSVLANFCNANFFRKIIIDRLVYKYDLNYFQVIRFITTHLIIYLSISFWYINLNTKKILKHYSITVQIGIKLNFVQFRHQSKHVCTRKIYNDDIRIRKRQKKPNSDSINHCYWFLYDNMKLLRCNERKTWNVKESLSTLN